METVSAEILNTVTDVVVTHVGKDVRYAAYNFYAETLDDDALREQVVASVWIVCAENPELQDPEQLVPLALVKLKETNEFLGALEEAKTQNNRRTSLSKWMNQWVSGNRRPTLWEQDEADLEYEEALATNSAFEWLVKLLLEGMDPNFALAVILYYCYGYSVPKILYVLGVTEDIGTKQFNSLRVATWRALGDGKRKVEGILTAEQVAILRRHFGQRSIQ